MLMIINLLMNNINDELKEKDSIRLEWLVLFFDE